MSQERIAQFQIVSLCEEVKDYYNNIKLPERATAGSAGYDFYLPFDLTIEPGETKKIYSGIRAKMRNDYVLMIFPRSSLGTKYKLTIDNTVGVIDSDYYNAKNEGHIIIQVTNHGDKTLTMEKGERFVQGVFLKFGITEDDNNTQERTGGIGSTGRK